MNDPQHPALVRMTLHARRDRGGRLCGDVVCDSDPALRHFDGTLELLKVLEELVPGVGEAAR